MIKQTQFLIGLTAVATALGFAGLPNAIAQNQEQPMQIGQNRPASNNFDGRGVAQGSAFTRGRNATTALTVDRDNFGFELMEMGRTDASAGRAQVRYRGAVIRRINGSTANSFTLDGRVRSYDSSANLRVLSNTTGTCRIEVFDARVISSSCRAATADSSTQFLGLEQF